MPDREEIMPWHGLWARSCSGLSEIDTVGTGSEGGSLAPQPSVGPTTPFSGMRRSCAVWLVATAGYFGKLVMARARMCVAGRVCVDVGVTRPSSDYNKSIPNCLLWSKNYSTTTLSLGGDREGWPGLSPTVTHRSVPKRAYPLPEPGSVGR